MFHVTSNYINILSVQYLQHVLLNKKMFISIFFVITLIVVINFIRKINKKPEGLESIPNVSTLEILWANLQQKNYDEIEDLIQRRSGDHGIYFVNINVTHFYLNFSYLLKNIYLFTFIELLRLSKYRKP